MAGRGGSRERDQALLNGEDLLKTVFKAVKAAAWGLGLDRVFITGVSPIVLSDARFLRVSIGDLPRMRFPARLLQRSRGLPAPGHGSAPTFGARRPGSFG